MTEHLRRFHDLIEDGLESFRPRHCPKNIADRPPLFAQVLVLSQEVVSVDRVALAHGDGTVREVRSMPEKAAHVGREKVRRRVATMPDARAR